MINKLQYWIELNPVKLFYKIWYSIVVALEHYTHVTAVVGATVVVFVTAVYLLYLLVLYNNSFQYDCCCV